MGPQEPTVPTDNVNGAVPTEPVAPAVPEQPATAPSPMPPMPDADMAPENASADVGATAVDGSGTEAPAVTPEQDPINSPQ